MACGSAVCTIKPLRRQTVRWWAHRRHSDEDKMTRHYDEETGIAICTRIIEGETIKEICKDPDLPSERTVYRWLAAERTFWQLYARAREAQMDRWSDEIVEIADEAATATGERIDKEGNAETIVDPGAVQAAKLRIDTISSDR